MNQNENRAVKFILDLQNLESQEGNENIEFPNGNFLYLDFTKYVPPQQFRLREQLYFDDSFLELYTNELVDSMKDNPNYSDYSVEKFEIQKQLLHGLLVSRIFIISNVSNDFYKNRTDIIYKLSFETDNI